MEVPVNVVLPRCMLQTTVCVLADKELLFEKWDLKHEVEMGGERWQFHFRLMKI